MANFDDMLILNNLYVYKSVYLTNSKLALAKYNTGIDLGIKTITLQDPVYSWTRANTGIQYGDSDNYTNVVGKSVYISGTDINLSADLGTNKKITMVSENLDVVTDTYKEVATASKTINIYGPKTETVAGNVSQTNTGTLFISATGRVDFKSIADYIYIESYKALSAKSTNGSVTVASTNNSVTVSAGDDMFIKSQDDMTISNAGAMSIYNKGTSSAPLASAQTVLGLSLDGSNLSINTHDEKLCILSDQGIFERAVDSTFTILSRDTSVSGATKTITRYDDADSNNVAIFIGSNYGDIDIKTKNSKSIYVNSASNYSVTVASAYTSSVTGAYTSTVGGNYTNTITGTGSVQSTGDFTLSSGDEIALSATNAVYINSKAGAFLFRDPASSTTSTHINADKDKLELWAANGGGKIFVVSTVAGQGSTPITIADTTGYNSTSGTTTTKIFLATDTGDVDIKAKGVDHNIYLTANQGAIVSLAKDYTTEYSNSYIIQSSVQIPGRDYKSGLTLGSAAAELRGVYGVTLKSNSDINLNGATTNIYSDRTNPGGAGHINIITDSDYVTGGSNGYIHIYSGNVVDVKADTSIDLAAVTSISSAATTSNTMTGKSIVIEANATTASNGGISIQSTGANNQNDITIKHSGKGSVTMESVGGMIDIKSSKSGVSIQNLIGSGTGATNTTGILIRNQGSDNFNIESLNSPLGIKATKLILSNADDVNNTLFGTTIPASGTAGQMFFKIVS